MIAIYKITNKLSGKIYIGQTKNIKQRWQKHKYYARVRRGNAPLHKAIRSCGEDAFTIEIIVDNLSREDANIKEVELIAELKANHRDYGYNVTIGGEGHKGVFGINHPMFGKKRPDVIARNKAGIGRKLSNEHKLKISPVGRVHTQETKMKMAAKRKLAWASGSYENIDWVGAKQKQLNKVRYTETND